MHTKKNKESVITHFVAILLKYMEKFGLEPIDIAFLSSSTRVNIENLIYSGGSLELERVEAISQIFNLRHYEFCNPDYEMPEYDSLPEKTKRRIELRKKDGPYVPQTRNILTINEKIAIALSFFKKNGEFLTENLVTNINIIDAETTANTSLVGDRLKKSFSDYIIKTTKTPQGKGIKGRKPNYFKVSTPIPKKVLEDAIAVVGEYWFDNYKNLVEKDYGES